MDMGRMAASLDCRRRVDRAAHHPQPVGRQRSGVQPRRTDRVQHLHRMDLPDVCRQPDRWADAVGICRARTGIDPECGRGRDGHVGHCPIARAEPARPARGDPPGGRSGVHRHSAGTRLRHLGPGERTGDGLVGSAVVDDGVLGAGAREQALVSGRVGVRSGTQRAGSARVGAYRRTRPADVASGHAGSARSADDPGGGRVAARRIPDFPDGLLRPGGAPDRAGQGRLWQ